MIDVHLERPHADILQRLTGVGPMRFADIVTTLQNQGLEPKFLSDPRVVQAALDDLVVAEHVGILPNITPLDTRYVRIGDPTFPR